MQGLREALRLYFAEGQDAVLDRHRTLSEATKAGVLALGLELSGEYVERAWAVTAVKAPEGMDADEIVARVRADHRIVLAPGRGPSRATVCRTGPVGNSDRLDIRRGLAALEMTLVSMGCAAEPGTAVETGVISSAARPGRMSSRS